MARRNNDYESSDVSSQDSGDDDLEDGRHRGSYDESDVGGKDSMSISTNTVILGVLFILIIACIVATLLIDNSATNTATKSSLSGIIFLLFILILVFGCCRRQGKHHDRGIHNISNTTVVHYHGSGHNRSRHRARSPKNSREQHDPEYNNINTA